MIELRRALAHAHPELAHPRRYPWQLLGFVALAGGIVALSWLIVGAVGQGQWPLALGESIVLGWFWASMGLYTHELLHGSIIKSAWLCHALAVPGFLIYGLSPELWLTWHNRVHHHKTNISSQDPDSFGLWDELKHMPMIGFVMKRAPGSGHWLSWVYLPLNFSNQVLTVMWFFLWKSDPKLFAPARKGIAVAETLFTYVFWTALAFLIGGKAFLLVFLLPVFIGNLIVSGYILTTHLLSPLSAPGATNDPLENTLGVTTFPLFDAIHFRFGHHIEHHLYPNANHRDLPALRRALRALYPKRYRCMSHWQAIRMLLTTPRAYRDANTLWDPISNRTVDISRVGLN